MFLIVRPVLYQSPILTPTDAVPSGDVPIAVLSHLMFECDDVWQKEEYERQLVKELMVWAFN